MIFSCCMLRNCDYMSVTFGQTDQGFLCRPVLNLALAGRDHSVAHRPASSSALHDCQHRNMVRGCTCINCVAVAIWYYVKNR